MVPILIVHGGAGNRNDDSARMALIKLKNIVREVYLQFEKGMISCVDCVEQAVRMMEDDEMFNAGKGSVLNADGEVEMDASIMVGEDLAAGSVTVVKDIKNAITLARMVMEKTDHVMMAGEAAKAFGRLNGIETVYPGALVTQERLNQWRNGKNKSAIMCTVGSVAIDSHGKLAAATSTGGRNDKLVGRCSDTSVIGSGTYADDEIGAVSTTGHGETIMKVCLAHAIVKAMENGCGAQDATSKCITRMTQRLNNTAGAITLSREGDVGVAFSSKRMPWVYQKGNELHSGVDVNQDDMEIIKL